MTNSIMTMFYTVEAIKNIFKQASQTDLSFIAEIFPFTAKEISNNAHYAKMNDLFANTAQTISQLLSDNIEYTPFTESKNHSATIDTVSRVSASNARRPRSSAVSSTSTAEIFATLVSPIANCLGFFCNKTTARDNETLPLIISTEQQNVSRPNNRN